MKKYLFFIIWLAVAFFVGRYFAVIKKQLKKINLKPNSRLIIIVGVVCLSLGIILGKGSDYLKTIMKGSGKVNLKINTAKIPDKVLMLNSFESQGDISRWKTKNAAFEQSAEHVTDGKYSGKIVFSSGEQISNIVMKDLSEGNSALGNWRNYSQLRFDLYNAGDTAEKIAIKIKDINGKYWQTKPHIAPGEKTEIKVYISELGGSIDTSRVDELNLFRWQPRTQATFYIDNIRLEPPETKNSSLLNLSKYINPKGKFLYEQEDSPFGLAVESPIEKVFLEPDKFRGIPTDTIEISLARNEFEAAQLVVYAKKPLENIQI